MVYEVKAPITGSVWMPCVAAGQTVRAGETVVIMECMKMEFPVIAEKGGIVVFVCESAASVEEGEVVARIEEIAP